MRKILEKLKKGEISLEEAEKRLRLHDLKELGEKLKLDIRREQRTGIPEAVLASGKDLKSIIEASLKLVEENEFAIVTRLFPKRWKKLRKKYPKEMHFEYVPSGRILILSKEGFEHQQLKGKVGILTGGTADIPIAKEAEVTCKTLGCEVISEFDVGIASLYRTIKAVERMIKEDVNMLIVIAGMEGALPSVISSLVEIPIIAVPTDGENDYKGKGTEAAVTMLNTCSPGLSLVNNGFRAATFAVLILKQITKICENFS